MKQLKKVGKLLFSMKTAIAILILLIVACTVGSLIPRESSMLITPGTVLKKSVCSSFCWG